MYRLPELLKAPQNSIVYVTEGERDADTLAALEFMATTAGGVTSEWTPELAEPLKGRRVVILVDADRPGREYGEKVARALSHDRRVGQGRRPLSRPHRWVGRHRLRRDRSGGREVYQGGQ